MNHLRYEITEERTNESKYQTKPERNLDAIQMRSIIIINKTSNTSPSGEDKVVCNLLSQPHKHLHHGKLKKTQLREATNG